MSGTCPANGITGFPLGLTDSSNVTQDEYKATGIDYVTEMIDLQWGSEMPKISSGSSTSVYLQDTVSNSTSVIFNRIQFKLYNVQIVNTTHRKFITDTSAVNSERSWTSLYLYDLFILFQNIGSDSNDSFIAFIIPIKHHTLTNVNDPNYFTAAIEGGSGTLASTIPSGKMFVHYNTCFNGYTLSNTNTKTRKYLHVFLCTEPISVKQDTIKRIVLGGADRVGGPPSLPHVLPANFGTITSTKQIKKSEFYQYIQTTNFGITNIGDDDKAKGIITDSTEQYQCLQLDPDKIDNNSLHFDMINGEIKTTTSLDALIQERTALKMIMNGEASGGAAKDSAGRVKNKAAYATTLAVLISIILFFYIYFSVLYGKTDDIRNVSQFVVAFLSILFFFIAFMVFLYNDTTVSQWLAGTGVVLSFSYWLFFYALFPAKKECDTNDGSKPAEPTTPPAYDWGAWIPKWSSSELIRTIIIVVISVLFGFITGAING